MNIGHDRTKEITGIDCSPQSNRGSTQLLRVLLYNDITCCKEELNCEMHTKFKTYNRDRFNQDRIYFHPGKEGEKNGNVIIKHIGKHL